MKDSSKPLVLLIVPAMVLLVGAVMRLLEGPFYYAFNSDPEYSYLLNALLILEGQTPHHVDHPGTTLQLLIAATVRVVSFFKPDEPLVTSVLTHPEFYLHVAHGVILSLTALASFVLGYALHKATQRTGLTLFLQALPFLFFGSWLNLARVFPESLIMPLGCLFTACGLLLHTREHKINPYYLALLMGSFGALATMSKITFLPIACAGFFLCFNHKEKSCYILSTITVGALAFAPAFPKFMAMIGFFGQIATHAGHYGTGPEGLVDLSLSLRFILALLWREPLFFLLFACLSYLLIREVASHCSKALFTPAVGLWLACFVLLLLVIKHPRVHYLTPIFTTLPLIWVLSPQVLQRFRSLTARFTRLPIARKRLLKISGAIILTSTLGAQIINVWQQRNASARAAEAIEEALRNQLHITSYLSSDKAYALAMGNSWTGHHFAEELDEIYPGRIFYSAWSRQFHQFGPVIEFQNEQQPLRTLSGSSFLDNPERLPNETFHLKFLGEEGGEAFYVLSGSNPEIP